MAMSRSQLRAVARTVAEDLLTPGRLTIPPLVGLKELGRMFDVRDNTPYQWRSKKLLPREDGLISNNPVWKLATIYPWAHATGRTIVWDPWAILIPAPSAEASSAAAPAADAPEPVPPATLPAAARSLLRARLRAVATDLATPGPIALPAVVGPKELVRMFDVRDNTPYQWRSKKVLPGEDGEMSNNPVWKPATIYAWAAATGRDVVWHPWAAEAPALTTV